MISDDAISDAKLQVFGVERPNDSNDGVRIAYQWLDAQVNTKNPVQKSRALKHMIENWAGRYVSQSDVEVAAYLHPRITGSYPRFNISSHLTLPAEKRLSGIPSARTQSYDMRNDEREYSHCETPD